MEVPVVLETLVEQRIVAVEALVSTLHALISCQFWISWEFNYGLFYVVSPIVSQLCNNLSIFLTSYNSSHVTTLSNVNEQMDILQLS